MSADKHPTNIMQLTQLVIAVGALGLGGGSFFKAPDTTAVVTGHKLHEAEIARLESSVLRLHRDLRNMRAFMEGYVIEQHELELDAIEAAEAAPRRRGRTPAPPRRKRRKSAPPLPTLSKAPKQVEHLDLDVLLDLNDAQLQQEFEAVEAAMVAEEAMPEFDYAEMEALAE